MRILIVQPTCDKRGHYGIWTVKMCQALGKKGHEVTLYTNKVCPNKYVKEDPTFSICEVDDGKYSFEEFDKLTNKSQLYYYYGYFRNSYVITSAALELSHKKTFDVIFITDVEFMIASFLLKKYSSELPPIVVHINAANFSFGTYAGSIIKKSYKVLQREIFEKTLGREIKAIVVLGGWHRERLRSQLRLDEGFPIEVIPDGGEEPQEVLDRTGARNTIGIDYNGPILLFFGMLRKDKGIEYLLQAVSNSGSEHFRLLIAGSPMDYTESDLKRTIQRLNIREKVILRLKYIPDNEVPFYFFASDVLVLPYPSIYTGGSGPLIKGACTHGRPVIATDVSGMAGLIRQYNMGLVAEPQNPQSLSQKMKEFLSLSKEKREEMARNALNLAKANSWDVMAERYTELYEKILQQ